MALTQFARHTNILKTGYCIKQQLPGAMKKSLAAGMPPSSYKDVFTAYFSSRLAAAAGNQDLTCLISQVSAILV
ncbi:MAG: hypothetical protein L0Z73_04955 [Gammaproteobacteria bacterium]|nr:hypothetical protein [Gammaproteobacteria bacterium]